MNVTDAGCTVTISRARYAELVVAEQDAKRLKEIIADRANEFIGLSYSEIKTLRDLLIPETKEEGA